MDDTAPQETVYYDRWGREIPPPTYTEASGPWRVAPVKGGWHATGRTWAAWGATEAEAVAAYWQAYARRCQLTSAALDRPALLCYDDPA